MEERSGFLPNVFAALSWRPDEARAFFAMHDALMDKETPGLSKADRELVVEYAFGSSGALEELRVDGVDLDSAGLRRCHEITAGADGNVFVNSADGQLALREVPRFADLADVKAAGSLVSPMPGAVIR